MALKYLKPGIGRFLCLGTLLGSFIYLGGLVASVHAQSPSGSEPQRITILHTNDHHGRFWNNPFGEYGMAARKTLIDRIRAEVSAEGGYVLLLSGGDINTGIPESDMLDAEPDFKGMTLLGYDAMAVGNHEFDNPLEVIRKQQSWANFPFLAANIYDSDGQRLFQPYQLFDLGGVSVAVVGFTTKSTEVIGNRDNIEGIKFTWPEQEFAALIPELSEADLVISVTHMGHHDGDMGNDISLAESTDAIDLIVGGHSAEAVCVDERGQLIADYLPGQDCVPDFVNGTWILQAQDWGKYLGRADLLVSDNGAELLDYQLIPVNLRRSAANDADWVDAYIEPDAEALALLQPYQDAGSSALSEKVTVATGTFDRDIPDRRPNPSTIGALISESMIQATGADIAIMNYGGIRDKLLEGTLTTKSILQVHPFGSTIVLSRMTGSELLEYFRAIKVLPDNPYKVQFAGMQFLEDGGLVLTSTGQPIVPSASYSLALNSYLAKGGDAMPVLSERPDYQDTGLLDYQVLLEYLQHFDAVSPEDY